MEVMHFCKKTENTAHAMLSIAFHDFRQVAEGRCLQPLPRVQEGRACIFQHVVGHGCEEAASCSHGPRAARALSTLALAQAKKQHASRPWP